MIRLFGHGLLVGWITLMFGLKRLTLGQLGASRWPRSTLGQLEAGPGPVRKSSLPTKEQHTG